MMICKMKTEDAFRELSRLPRDYMDWLHHMDVPPHLKDLLRKVITVLLRKINVPNDEVNEFIKKIDERGISEMVSIDEYDVQETRKIARAEARAEIKAEIEQEKREKREAELQAGVLARLLMENGFSEKTIAESLKTTEQKVRDLVSAGT